MMRFVLCSVRRPSDVYYSGFYEQHGPSSIGCARHGVLLYAVLAFLRLS